MSVSEDIKHTHGAIAHDASSIGMEIARMKSGFADLNDQQKLASTGWITTKVLLIALERTGVISQDDLDRLPLRDKLYEVLNEFRSENNE